MAGKVPTFLPWPLYSAIVRQSHPKCAPKDTQILPLLGLCFPYSLGKKVIQQYQQLSLHLWEDFLPRRLLQSWALPPSYWNLLSAVSFFSLFFIPLIKSVNLREWALGVWAGLFIPVKDGDGGEGNVHQNVGSCNWKIFKYLKGQVCFSISLIWHIHHGLHLISRAYGPVFVTKTSFSPSDGQTIRHSSLVLTAGWLNKKESFS